VAAARAGVLACAALANLQAADGRLEAQRITSPAQGPRHTPTPAKGIKD
jgi:hypothetical protein